MVELNCFGQEAKFHHIGIGVRSIKDVTHFSERITDPIQKVSVAFLFLNGIQVELIEPYGHDSPIRESLDKGVKFLHICYEVSDIEMAIRTCRKHGFHCISQPVPAVAFNNRKIAWVYSNQYGLYELLED